MEGDKEFKEYVREQFKHGQRHFERFEEEFKEFREIVGNHAAVLNSLNEGVLEGANDRAEFVDELMTQQRERTALLKAMREEVAKKTAVVLVVCLTAFFLMQMGLDEYAKKVMGIE